MYFAHKQYTKKYTKTYYWELFSVYTCFPAIYSNFKDNLISIIRCYNNNNPPSHSGVLTKYTKTNYTKTYYWELFSVYTRFPAIYSNFKDNLISIIRCYNNNNPPSHSGVLTKYTKTNYTKTYCWESFSVYTRFPAISSNFKDHLISIIRCYNNNNPPSHSGVLTKYTKTNYTKTYCWESFSVYTRFPAISSNFKDHLISIIRCYNNNNPPSHSGVLTKYTKNTTQWCIN